MGIFGITIWHLHCNFSSRLFNLLLPFFLIGRKCASTCMNCRKLTRSSALSTKNACTMRSHSGLMASSGIRRKSSRDNVPQSVRSSDVKREYRRSIWLAVTGYSCCGNDLENTEAKRERIQKTFMNERVPRSEGKQLNVNVIIIKSLHVSMFFSFFHKCNVQKSIKNHSK